MSTIPNDLAELDHQMLLDEACIMRKLLVDIGDSMYAEWPVEALHDAVDRAKEYLAGLPKGE